MNKMKVVSYRPAWESQFNWIKKDKNSNSAFCNVCQVSFRIDNSGLSQVKTRGSTKAHKDKETLLSGKTSQKVLVLKDNGISLSEESLTLSCADQVLNAETLQALDTVFSNHSFASTKVNNDKLRRMFPDSQIAKSVHQAETKTKYIIQFGVAPYVRKQVIEDFTGQPFTFQFDETTTSQIKKQYDGYVQFWSLSKNMIMNRFAFFQLSTSTMLSIYFALFHSYLNYGLSLWGCQNSRGFSTFVLSYKRNKGKFKDSDFCTALQ